MISESEIEQYCNSRTLQRARQIAASDKNILTKKCRYSDFDVTLSAFVASSSGWDDRYRTSVTCNDDEDDIIDYSCTCPAYREYEGMCKHCTALLLSYNDAPQKFLGYQSHHTAATSPSLAEFMKRVQAASPEYDRGSLRIETAIVYGYHNWSAHFKITGPQGSYVIKSITDFVEHMRDGDFFSYGKKLAFTHSPALLDERSQRIERFLDQAVTLRGHVNRTSYWRSGSREEVGRSIDLSEAELIELLDLLDGETFTVEGTDYGTRAVTHARIVEGDPHIDLELRPTDKQGYALVKTEHITLAAHGDRMYIWQDDVFYRCTPEFARCADFLRALYESDEDRLFVAETDMPLFCATALPAAEKHLNVLAPHEVEAYRPVPCELEFYFDKIDSFVLCNAKAKYGTTEYSLFEREHGTTSTAANAGQAASHETGPLRNDALEAKARQLVQRYFAIRGKGGLPQPKSCTKKGRGQSKQSVAARGLIINEARARTNTQRAILPEADPAEARNTAQPDAYLGFDDGETIARLLFGGLLEFKALGEVFTTPAFDRLLIDQKPRVTMGLSLAGNLINLTIAADDLPEGELGALLSSYRRRKRYHRLQNGAFMDLAGMNLSQLDRLSSDLGISEAQLASGNVELPSYRAFYLDEELNEAERDGSFTHYVESFRTVDQRAYQVPAALADVLRPYQVDGFRWLSALTDMGFDGVLADEMGLGKSVQLISLLLDRAEEAREVGPSLIVCPASLVYNWTAEFERFAPQLRVRAVAGTKRERMRARAARNCDVMITSYDLLRIDVDDYADREFYCHVLDEAQYIKNPATLTTRSVKRIRARHRFALTGTPMENRLSELWSIFDFLMPGFLGSYMHFREHYELDIVGGDEDTARRLQALVGPFMLRRLKADVLKELPDKWESVVYTQMKGEQQRLYAAHEQQLRESLTEQRHKQLNESKVEVLAELTKLRQLCCDPHLLYENYRGHAAKLDTIMDLVESAMDADQKTLVFSQFTSFLSVIAGQLDKHDIPYYTITGSTPKGKRIKLVNAFNEDDTSVFLVSLKAGGTGLNLTGASVVIHADPWWNAAAQNQATDRAHRIGQTQVVSVHKVIAKGTIEERIVHLQEAKADLADQIIGAGSVSLASLTKEDLLDLLQG